MRISINDFHSKTPTLSPAIGCGAGSQQREQARGRRFSDDFSDDLAGDDERLIALESPRSCPDCLLLPSLSHKFDHYRVKQSSPRKSTCEGSLVEISPTTTRAVRCAVSVHVRRVNQDDLKTCRRFIATSTRLERTAEIGSRDKKSLILIRASLHTSDPGTRRSRPVHENCALRKRRAEREWGVSGRRPPCVRQRSRSALRPRCCRAILFWDNVSLMVVLA